MRAFLIFFVAYFNLPLCCWLIKLKRGDLAGIKRKHRCRSWKTRCLVFKMGCFWRCILILFFIITITIIFLVIECTNSTYSDPDDGIISSPNYPGFYSNNLNCSYLIDLRTSSDHVLIRFTYLYTQADYDFVKVI